jgi:hypothetical protein
MPVTFTSDSLPDAIRRQLGAGEAVLWHGRPRRGLLLRPADAFTIPFGLAWLGLAAWMPGTSWPSNTVKVLFLAVGSYTVFGRFAVDAYARTRIWYAVTGERILIVSTAFVHRVKSLNVAGLSELRLSERRSGEGTIVFGPEPPTLAFRQRCAGIACVTQPPAPRFEAIPDARLVHELVRSVQRRMRGQG